MKTDSWELPIRETLERRLENRVNLLFGFACRLSFTRYFGFSRCIGIGLLSSGILSPLLLELLFGLPTAALAQVPTPHPVLPINPKFLKEVATCQSGPSPQRMVYLIKQWHLPPSQTKVQAPTQLPQYQNQLAIYQQLVAWAKQNPNVEFLAEGCNTKTPIDDAFTFSFNGWTIQELKKESHKPHYEKIMTHVLLKLKAFLGAKIKVQCSDQEALIQKSQSALSDVRADAAYYSRLEEFKDRPERLKIYLDGVIESYHLAASTDRVQAEAALDRALKADLSKARELNDQRSQVLVDTIIGTQKQGSIPASVPLTVAVWGGLHAPAVKAGLEKAGIGCKILEPVGYVMDEEKMFSVLQRER